MLVVQHLVEFPVRIQVAPRYEASVWSTRFDTREHTHSAVAYIEGMNFKSGNHVPSKVGGQGTAMTWWKAM